MSSYTSGGVVVLASDPLTGLALDATIGSIVSIDIPTNVESVSDDSGSIYDEGHAITHFEPIANVVSKSIFEVFSVIGVGGQCFIDDTDPGVDIFGKKRGDCLTDVNTTDHSRYRIGNGLLTLGTLQASRGSDATIGFMVDGITDGTNAPLVITHGVALPATLIKGQWELAIGKIAGTVFKPTDLTINFNVQKEKPRPLAPSIWNDRIAVSKVQPVVTARGIDPSQISAAGIDITGESATHVNTLFQLVKRQTGGSYVAAGTLEHIGITVAGLVVVTNPFSVSGQSDATVDIEIRTIHDGTNIPVLIDTTFAYDSTP
jgi:hypothetical protein